MKGGLAIVLADAYKKGKGKDDKKEDMEEESSMHEDLAQEALDAIAAKDAEGLASALKSFVKACMKDY